MPYKRIGLLSDDTDLAKDAHNELASSYDVVDLNSASEEAVDVVIALGGDGFMLKALHAYFNKSIPIYGMNRGSVGFLMNEYRPENLEERLAAASGVDINPLRMRAKTTDGKVVEGIAFNEVALLRHSKQAAKIRISIDEQVRMEEMVCDGVVVSTPAGSSAYNASLGGPVIPLKTWLLAVTPISPFRPRRWRGALLPDRVNITLDMLENAKRPVNATADFFEIENVSRVDVNKDITSATTLLFDPGHSLEERILREQFTI